MKLSVDGRYNATSRKCDEARRQWSLYSAPADGQEPLMSDASRDAKSDGGDCCAGRNADHSGNAWRDYIEIAAAALIVAATYLSLTQLDLIPRSLAVSDNLNYGLILVIGLAASVSTCIAVTGGLLVAIAARYSATHAHVAGPQQFKLHLYFNAGRIISYALLGGAIGALGATLTFSAEANAILIVLASLVMIVLGLQMLKLLPPLGTMRLRMPAPMAERVRRYTAGETGSAAFLLGASTFFFPCGFTQALQLYVLAKGSALTGALTMLVFALGTLPALLSLSAISSFLTGKLQIFLFRLAGVAVVVLGIVNIQHGVVLSGNSINWTSLLNRVESASGDGALPLVDGKQIAEMKIVGLDYEPHRFSVKQGVPVLWRIDASEAAGCGRILIAPKLGIRRLLSPVASNVIAFTPNEPGDLQFNCGMGMMTPDSGFTVVPDAKG